MDILREWNAYRATGLTPEECAELARERAALEQTFSVPFMALAKAAAEWKLKENLQNKEETGRNMNCGAGAACKTNGGGDDAQGSEGLYRRGGEGGC